MAFTETKVYFDGSHYIAIPHTTRFTKKRPSPPEEVITVIENVEGSESNMANEPSIFFDNDIENNNLQTNEKNVENNENVKEINKPVKSRKLTKKALFEELYMKYINLRKNERKNRIKEDMLIYFQDEEKCKIFVENNFERKTRNLICKRVRMCRKANLADFNYFVTLTYDDKLHTEITFKKKLKVCFRNLCFRKNWKYMGVWERAPKTNRLHFHGLFKIPDIEFLKFEICRDYDTRASKMRVSNQSTYFNEKFGRNDFEKIDPQEKRLGNALAYLMKYLEKTNEKIVYSKGLPQYFISDILDQDIVCPIGQEDKKLLLFDDFMCLDEGCLIGKVSPEVIAQMRKSN